MTATLQDLVALAEGAVPTPDAPLDFSQDALAQSLAIVPIPGDQKYSTEELAALLQRGIRLHTGGNVRGAMECYREVLLYDRANAKALYFSAIALSQESKDEAKVAAIMEHAVSQLQRVPEAHYNLGILYHRMGRIADARACFEKAIELYPKLVEAKTSLAGCLLNQGEASTGRATLENACATHCVNPDSVYARGFAHLTLGHLGEGWRDYRSRWRTAAFLTENRRSFGNARHWNGKPIPGKVLYVHTEQGAGDIIMFSRFLAEVKRRSQCRVLILEVGANVAPFVAQCEGVDYTIESNTPVPVDPDTGSSFRVDCYLPFMSIMSLVGIFGYDRIYGAEGWLFPVSGYGVDMPARFGAKLRVGLSWAGSSAHKNDRYRTIGWAKFRDLLVRDPRFEKVQWYSLQVGEHARDLDDGNAGKVLDCTPQMTTFAHTAAAVKQLDLLICVDTATVHVAGALVGGPETWVLLPAAPDWRWLLDGEHTPWYDDMTLFRQSRSDDWDTPLRAVADALAARLSAVGALT